jgi:hypothetical protein
MSLNALVASGMITLESALDAAVVPTDIVRPGASDPFAVGQAR